MKLLRYVFWRVYEWKCRQRTESSPLLGAFMIVVTVGVLNVGTLLLFVPLALGIKPLERLDFRALAIPVVGFVSLIMYALLLRNDRYLHMEKEFRGESDKWRLWRGRLILTYFIASAIGPLALSIWWGATHSPHGMHF